MNVELRRLWRALVRVAFSLLCACIFYSAWMAVFLLTTRLDSPAVETVLWLLAPMITAAGFATGVAVQERWAGTTRPSFLRSFIWPLIGCAVGAGIVYWFGPMLIVFAMLAAGTASIMLREMVGIFKRGKAARG